MRTLLLIATSLLIAQHGLAQGGRGGRGGGRGPGAEPAAPPMPGFECFERAETPEYPRSALQSLVDGTVYVTLQVSPQGAADKIETNVVSAWSDASKLLVPAVEKALRASKLKPDCAGKNVAVVFRYEVYGDRVANPKVTTKTEANVMYIESQPDLAATAPRSGAAAK